MAPACGDAYDCAYATDPTSAFGGIIAFNRQLDAATAKAILERQFVEVLIAPDYRRRRARLLSRRRPTCACCASPHGDAAATTSTSSASPAACWCRTRDIRDVTARRPEGRHASARRRRRELDDLLFAWQRREVREVQRHRLRARPPQTIGIGAGQMSRVVSAKIAALKAEEAGLAVPGSVMASDAFFPFRDGIDAAAAAGIARGDPARRLDARRRSDRRRRRARHGDGVHRHAAISGTDVARHCQRCTAHGAMKTAWRSIGIGPAAASTRWPGSSRSRRASPKCWSRPATPAPRARPSAATSPSTPPTSTALLALVEREGVAVTVVGPEGAAGRRRRRPLPRRRPAHLRPDRRRRAARRQQGLRQGFPRPPRHPDRVLRRCTRTSSRRSTYVRDKGAPIVIKADGLAAGKGVIVAMTLAEAEAAITDMLAGNAFGAAGARVVIEEFLDGEEASFISMVDGSTALPMATSQDHKRVGDGDTGPNTGGMGAYSPAPVVTPEVHARVMREVVEPDRARHGRRRRAVHRLPLRRADDRRRRRAEGDRIQRALRRSGNAAGDDAPAVATCSTWSRPRSTGACTEVEARLGSAPGAGRGDGRRELSGHAAHWATRSTAGTCRTCPTPRSSTPAPRLDGRQRA